MHELRTIVGLTHKCWISPVPESWKYVKNVSHELQKIHISEYFSNSVEYILCMAFSPFLGFLDNSPHLILGLAHYGSRPLNYYYYYHYYYYYGLSMLRKSYLPSFKAAPCLLQLLIIGGHYTVMTWSDDPLPIPQMATAGLKWCSFPATIVSATKQLHMCFIWKR